MKYADKQKVGSVLVHERLLPAEQFNDVPVMVDLPFAADTLLPDSQDHEICADYSEEAIPERDPAYQLSDATLYETQTCAHIPAAERLALARCLAQLGMTAARAAMISSL
jgi:hypothetical protein